MPVSFIKEIDVKISSASRTNHQFDAYTGISGSESNIPAERKMLYSTGAGVPATKALKVHLD